MSLRILKNIARKLAGKVLNSYSEATAPCCQCAAVTEFYEDILRDPMKVWLYQNREERMDASVGIFNECRRRFHLARYEFACSFSQGKVVADIACGTGYGTELVRSTGNAQKVYGVDISTEAIMYASIHHAPEGTNYICSSGESTGLADESVDLVVSFETIEHVPDDIALLKEFHRILKPGGVLVCSTPNEWPLEVASYHVREYGRSSFTSLLSRFFDLLNLYNQNSGSASPFNHGQEAGIIETTDNNFHLAECFIAVCRKN